VLFRSIREKIEIKRLAGIFWECLTCEIENKYFLHIYYSFLETDGLSQDQSFSRIIQESRQQSINNMYSYRLDQCNYMGYNPEKTHIHVYKRGSELCAINRDGTAHDGCHGVRIPNVVADYISRKFPDITLPRGNIIESIDKYYSEESGEILFLLEEKN
jgi:hypothetical protein